MGFSAITNQEYAKAQLIADLTAQHFPSYLFVGPRGVGKRTTALVLAKALCCEKNSLDSCDECYRCKAIEKLAYPDLKVIFPVAPNTDEEKIAQLLKDYAYNKIRPETASNATISIERIRAIKYEMGFSPIAGRRRIVIILNADKMTNEAANAFLKTLEEPQAQTSFILTTERYSTLPATIRSRCRIVRFFGIPIPIIIEFLLKKYQVPETDAQIAAEVAEGSLRRALAYLNSPDLFVAETVKELFEKKPRAKANFSQLSIKFGELPTQSLINSLLFLYRQTLLAKLGIKTRYSEISKSLVDPENKISTESILAKIEYLLKTLDDAELYLNKRLFFHSILVRFLSND